MQLPFIAIPLAPLLFAQGLYVRRVTPRLPEANGSREGALGRGEPLSLLLLGDSAAAGVGVDNQSEALAGQLTGILSKTHTVHWRLFANNGKTSDELFKEVKQYSKQAIDWVVVSIGVNDVTGMTSRKQWSSNLSSIAKELEHRFYNPKIIWTSLPPMHLFPALPQPLRHCLGLRAKQLSQDLMEVVASLENNYLLTINAPVEHDFIADDGFHPSAKTYRLWAEAAAQIIKQN